MDWYDSLSVEEKNELAESWHEYPPSEDHEVEIDDEGNTMKWAHHRGGKTIITDNQEDRPFSLEKP